MRGKRAKLFRKLAGVNKSEPIYIYLGGTRVLDNGPGKMYLSFKNSWKYFIKSGNAS